MFFLSISEVDKPILIMQLYSLYLHINSFFENGLPQKFRSSTRSFLMENQNTEFRNEQITIKPVQSKKETALLTKIWRCNAVSLVRWKGLEPLAFWFVAPYHIFIGSSKIIVFTIILFFTARNNGCMKCPIPPLPSFFTPVLHTNTRTLRAISVWFRVPRERRFLTSLPNTVHQDLVWEPNFRRTGKITLYALSSGVLL